MGFYFGGKKAWEAVPLFSLNLLHLPSGHILCPVHEAPLTDQLHLGAWEETAVHCGRAVFWEPSGERDRHFQR